MPGNQRSVRLAFLVGTAASVPMAAAVETAFDGSGLLFAVPLAVVHLMALAVMLIGVETGTSEFRSAVKYGVPNLVAMWIVSILIVVWSTVRAGGGDWAHDVARRHRAVHRRDFDRRGSSVRRDRQGAPRGARCRRGHPVAADDLHSVWLIVVIDVLAVAGLIAEHLRIEVRPSSSRESIHHTHD